MPSDKWFLSTAVAPGRLRMFCFSYAGGGPASYSSWQTALGSEIEVLSANLPGRGKRLHEPPVTSLSELVGILANHIDFSDARPFVFFGHSLGGLVAFELARFCKAHDLPGPSALFVSGCNPPQQRTIVRPLHLMNDDDLVRELREYGGTSHELLENRELMLLVSPAIRADFSLAANFEYRPDALLEIPIIVLGGDADPGVDPLTLPIWQKETISECRVRLYGGEHFFILSNSREILSDIRADILRIELI